MPRRLASLLAPPLCGICGDNCAPSEPICPACAEAITTSPTQPLAIPGADHAWAAAPYEGVPRRLVAALKFGARTALAGVAAAAIARRAAPGELRGALVPVPADPLRHRLRGFDPASLIAQELAKTTGLPLCHCLARRHAPRQVGRTRAERLAGPPVRPASPAPTAAVVVDDVVTTGSTLAGCAMALRGAGASEVLAVAFARA